MTETTRNAGTTLSDARARAAFRRVLLHWFRRHARELPWRETKDPYRIWLSETMLQQTRVETVVPYYARFVRKFPTVQALAAAADDDVLEMWAGLGYYRRARNLLKAAQLVAQERDGQLPTDATALRRLPGVGRYTAGAVASIAFGKRAPVLDGNVKRVLARLFQIESAIDAPRTIARLWALAEELVPRTRPGDFNQAVMELGALVCLPKNPACSRCPVRRWCSAESSGRQHDLPLRRPKRRVPQIEAVAAAVCKNGRILMVKRPADELLGGLWELPGGPLDDAETHTAALKRHLSHELGIRIDVRDSLGTVTHAFSHRTLRLHIYRCRHLRGRLVPRRHEAARWVSRSGFERLALASLDRKVLRRL